MLTLYVKTGCPYCAMVLHKLDELGTPFTEKNIADPAVVEELVARGGKRQVPYLVDAECNREMYESGDIVEYLEARFGSGKGEGSADGSSQTCEIS